MLKVRHALSTALCLFTLTANWASGATIIETLPAWNETSFMSDFGIPDTATYGQTLTTPIGDNVLNSFTFVIGGSENLTLKAYVYAWDGAKATGSALYESGSVSVNTSGFTPYTFNTGGISLVSGAQYVLFTSVSALIAQPNAVRPFGYTASDPYLGGNFVYQNNAGFTNAWTNDSWSNFGGSDLAFSASFGPSNPSAVPEPSAVVSMILGGLTLAAFRLRRKA